MHALPNPFWQLVCVGFFIYSAITFSLLHMIYEGTWKVIVESTFGLLKQRSESTAAFNALGARMDVWIVVAVAPTPYVKTSFTKGISRYLHGAMSDAANPWAAAIKFGKITSKDTWRDISTQHGTRGPSRAQSLSLPLAHTSPSLSLSRLTTSAAVRFWRMLMFDVLPSSLELCTDYLEWVRLVLLPAPTDANLVHAETYYEAWLTGAIQTFGEARFQNRIKAHAPNHFRTTTRKHASSLFNDDSLAESAHIEGAKEPWDRTSTCRAIALAQPARTTIPLASP